MKTSLIGRQYGYCRSAECQEELAKWNMTLDTDLIKFEARTLVAEQIFYYDV